MKPDDVPKMLAQRVDELRSVPEDATAVLVREAKAVASKVKAIAARSRHSIDVRVVARGHTVRVTVVGQQASRYRALVGRELEARVPSAKAEIRSIAKGKSR